MRCYGIDSNRRPSSTSFIATLRRYHSRRGHRSFSRRASEEGLRRNSKTRFGDHLASLRGRAKRVGNPILNPVHDIKLPQHGNARTRRLEIGDHEAGTKEERLLQACRNARNPYLLPIVQLALETAMRRGELLNLKWEHIDLDSKIAFLPDTKNGESRTVPLSSIAVSVLRKLPRSKHPNVFRGMTAEAIKRSYMRALRRAEIEGLRFHDLRHEATTRLFEKGLNIMEVASITGHKDLAMLRRHTHLKAEDLAKKLG